MHILFLHVLLKFKTKRKDVILDIQCSWQARQAAHAFMVTHVRDDTGAMTHLFIMTHTCDTFMHDTSRGHEERGAVFFFQQSVKRVSPDVPARSHFIIQAP